MTPPEALTEEERELLEREDAFEPHPEVAKLLRIHDHLQAENRELRATLQRVEAVVDCYILNAPTNELIAALGWSGDANPLHSVATPARVPGEKTEIEQAHEAMIAGVPLEVLQHHIPATRQSCRLLDSTGDKCLHDAGHFGPCCGQRQSKV